MKNKLRSTVKKAISLVATLLLVLSSFTAVFTVSATEDTVNPTETVLKAIIDFNTGSENGTVEEWINGSLSESPNLNEWYAMGIAKAYPEAVLTAYAEALTEYLANNQVYSATTKQKYGLALIACGDKDSEYLTGLVDETAGKQGIMSYVFAMHLLNNGVPSDKFTVENIIPILLDLACEGGGWSLTGTVPDTDVTAMTVQALAPYYDTYEEVKIAIDGGITALSAMQKDSGGFISYGVENPESSAQVIIALLSLGRDPLTDPGFIKNGNSPLTAMLSFALDDGSFSHTADGQYNLSATAQTFMALSALTSEDTAPFFLFAELPTPSPTLDHTLLDSINGEDNETEGGNTAEEPEPEKSDYKLPVCIAIVLIALSICAVMFFKKQRAPSNYLLVVIIAALLCSAVLFINITSPDDYYKPINKDNPIGTVTVEIICDTDLVDAKDAVILGEITVPLEEGETVYDILLQVTKANSIPLSTVGGGVAGGIYIRGIAGIHEFDHGDLSGWTYSVNGEKISAAADKITLKDGDKIVWLYSDTLY